MSLAKKINLRENEEIIEVVRSAGVLSFFGYVFGLLILLTTSFFSTWLLTYGRPGSAAVGAGLFFGLLFIFRAWLKRRYNYWVITNLRIVDIDRLGFFNKVISEIWFEELADIYIHKKGILAGIFNYADIVAESVVEQYVLEIKKIYQPEKFIEWIRGLKKDFEQVKEVDDQEVLLKNFIKIIPSLSEDDLEEIQVRVKEQIKLLTDE